MIRKLITLFAISLTLTVAVQAQDENTPIISAENIEQLGSVQQIDFVSLPQTIGAVDSGWFIMSPDGNLLAVVRQDGGLVVFDTAGELIDTYVTTGNNDQPGTVVDAVFGSDNHTLAALHTDGEDYFISLHDTEVGVTRLIEFPISGDYPVRLWLDDAITVIWLEVAPGNPDEQYYVLRLPIDGGEDMLTLPSGPQNDSDAFVRIGRIPAPLAITSTPQGLVRLWDLESDTVLSEVQLNEVPVFGRIEETNGRYLAWRDTNSENLHLLDFQTGQDRLIAPLDGAYIQAFLLTPAADVVLAVSVDNEPVVTAWNVSTGERYDLGPYRACARVPDMARVNTEGTTLVIGCDSGLDVWRIVEE